MGNPNLASSVWVPEEGEEEEEEEEDSNALLERYRLHFPRARLRKLCIAHRIGFSSLLAFDARTGRGVILRCDYGISEIYRETRSNVASRATICSRATPSRLFVPLFFLSGGELRSALDRRRLYSFIRSAKVSSIHLPV